MSLEAEHERWINEHLLSRKGERLDALKRGHGYGNRLFIELVWWPLAGHFQGLHPEYEMKDWRGKSYFVDLVWIAGMIRIIFEIMDYGSHGTDRSKYRRDLNRGLFLQSQGCIVCSISLDELKENPGLILSAVRTILSPYLSAVNGMTGTIDRPFGKVERDLMRLAVRSNRVIRPVEAARDLELHVSTVINHCRALTDKGKLRAVRKGKSERITSYEYIGALHSPDLI